MKEQVVKYMAQNARIFCVALNDAVTKSAELNGLEGGDRSLLGKLEVFSCCIAALQKDDRSSVTALLSLPEKGIFSATAEKDGIIRGRKEGSFLGTEAILEVTLQLPLRGNYTGFVCGIDLDDLVSAYFSQSLQINASCSVFEKEGGFFCIVAEQLPGVSCDLSRLCDAAEESFPQEAIPHGFEFLETTPLRFGCTCSRASLMRFVSAMPPEEQQELSEDGKIVTYCNACGKRYTFDL